MIFDHIGFHLSRNSETKLQTSMYWNTCCQIDPFFMFSEVVLYLTSWLIQSSYIFIIGESLKAAVCFSMSLHITRVDSILHVSELTVPVHIKLVLRNPFLI